MSSYNQKYLDTEKRPVCQPPVSPTSTAMQKTRWRACLPILLTLVVFYGMISYSGQMTCHNEPFSDLSSPSVSRCPQVEPITPSNTTVALMKMETHLQSTTFYNESVRRLSGAVQLPTVSYDDMKIVGEDDRWKIFANLSSYLKETFPALNSNLKLDEVNTYGLVWTWEGSDSSLKPTVLMAHQDVVPVAEATLSDWVHHPFSGHFDGRFVWGRGSSDCKNSLVGIMEAVELLIEAGFKPKRTLILAFGFDEEISGHQGAGKIAEFLVEKYKHIDGSAVIVDEGSSVLSTYGTKFAIPGVAEKGYIDVEIIVNVPGGHSSIPPRHTGIGIMSELIASIESHLYTPRIDVQNPFGSLLQCAVEYSSEFPSDLKKLIPPPGKTAPHYSDSLAAAIAEKDQQAKYLFTTSQAVDIIEGGVKNNALPERTRAVINHRVNIGESTFDVRKNVTKFATEIAQKHNLTLDLWPSANKTDLDAKSITLRVMGQPLEPAPVTPTSLRENGVLTPFAILSGTMRAMYGEALIVSPGLMTGNTDTKSYWNLSRHIFRCNPGWDPEDAEGLGGIHTVNEKVSMVNHVNTVRWYSLFVRNMDEAEMA